MPALELLTGFVTAPSTTLTALGMASGNSLTIRAFPDEAFAGLVAAWADNQADGILRIRSPRMHDNVQNIRLGIVASEPYDYLPSFPSQRLFTQDVIDVMLSGSAAAGDIETACMLIYYPVISGSQARLITPQILMQQGKEIMTVENTLALGTAGGYSGQEAINAEFDQLKANTDYALIGYHVQQECACIRWQGIDTGNLGLGGPGMNSNKNVTRNWFIDLSNKTGRPCIPVFNSANKNGILIDGAQDENGTDVTVHSIFVELYPGTFGNGIGQVYTERY